MKQYFLGIEFGSTRIKAVLLDEKHAIVKSGDYTWKSGLENGVWTYHMEDVQEGLRTAIRNLGELPGKISAMGVSGMMHGYLAFDKDWNLLAPFRTWQNTMTGEAAEQLTAEFGFNIPQRWSIAHLYQAVLNGEAHVKNIAHITEHRPRHHARGLCALPADGRKCPRRRRSLRHVPHRQRDTDV